MKGVVAIRNAGVRLTRTTCTVGSIQTELGRHTNALIMCIVKTVFLYDVSYGIITPLYAATSEEALGMNGEVRFSPNTNSMRSLRGSLSGA